MNYRSLSSVTEIINNGLFTAARNITKNYLINLHNNEVIPLEENLKILNAVRLYQIEKLVYDKKENINDKLISVYSSLFSVESSVLLIIHGKSKETTIYMGVRSNENASISGTILEKSFLGNFPGSTIRRMRNDEISNVLEACVASKSQKSLKNVSSVTVVPSMRDENKDKFVQGIEKFIDTMRGEEYFAVFIAQPMSKGKLELHKHGLEELYSAISPLAKTSLSYGENQNKSVMEGLSENFSHSINSGINHTNGANESKSLSSNRGFNIGFHGTGFNSGSSNSHTTGTSWSDSVSKGTSDSTSTGKNTSTTETSGTSKTMTLEHQDKSVAVVMEKIESQLKRIKDCEGFGLWDCSCYFLADDIQTSVVAANTYKALMLGDNTSTEDSYINVWDLRSDCDNHRNVLDYIKHGVHPILKIKAEPGYEAQIVTPGTYISGKELPILLGLPIKAVSGVPVSSIAEFGRTVFVQNKTSNYNPIRIGNVHHMGRTEEGVVNLDINSFTSHCFITGSTGSGKSNTTYCLLERFYQNNIPFLVIEPAKGEYKEAFGKLDNINIFSTNPLIGQMLKINPFRFDPQIHVLEHLDRLVEIFNACWEMYAAMPAILKDAIEKIYIDKGWDLLNSVYRGEGVPVYPTFNDLMKTLPNIINTTGYSSDTKGDYIGALVTRVTSLTNGISGQIFCDVYDIPDSILFDQNTIVDLSRVGSAETTSLIMGIVVLKLTEYRMANAGEANSNLKHITVLEEAHNLLKKVQGSASGNNLVNKSVEMICSSIAEMRTYGEGFIIVDQSPTAVDVAAIKNTNTKILMRLPEKGDCDAVGNATGLNDDQKKELSRLEVGVAVVMQNNWIEAVLTHIDRFSNAYKEKITMATHDELKELKGAAVKELMTQYIVDKTMDLQRIGAQIDAIDASYHKKKEIKAYMASVIGKLQKKRDLNLFCEVLYSLSSAASLFDNLESTIEISKDENNKYSVESLRTWKRKLNDGLCDYISLPNEYVSTMIEYLLFVQEERVNKIDYYEIQRILESEVK